MFSDRFTTVSLRDPRVIRIIEAALGAVDPALLVRNFLAGTPLPPHSRCFLLGLGKAAEAMTRGAAQALPTYEAALVITKRKTPAPIPRGTVTEAAHPIPDERSILAGQAALEFVSRLEPTDLLVCLISGGGSALAIAPAQGLSLQDVQDLTSAALNSGADIEEINNLRRSLDRLKGGGLAAATKARVLGVILSDVIGDRPEAIASGPTVPSRPDAARAARLLKSLSASSPSRLAQILKSSTFPRTGGPDDRIENAIIGNALSAAEGAARQAHAEGFAARIVDPAFAGEARLAGREFGRRLAIESLTPERPACMIAVGESTVTMSTPHGLGGRNQELALAAVEPLDSVEGRMLVSLATDGEDGPTDAAGAVVTGTTARRARAMGMDPAEFLQRHDSYTFFGTLGDLLRPGPTATNVNDIVLMLVL